MTRKASCCCGACSVEVHGEPALNAICHCNNCKRRSGSAFGWSAYFADAAVTARAGDFGLYEIAGTNLQRRWFCAACGTTLLWKADGWPSRTGIAGGCFTETPLPDPTVTVSNDGRCAWLGLPADWRTSL
jgi:hypothetical protein